MADGNRPQVRQTALHEFKFRLIGDPVNGERRPPTLGFGISKNQPTIVVKTNVQNDKDYGKITAKPTTADFFVILDLVDKAIHAEPGFKEEVRLHASRFISGQPSKEPMLDSRVVVGKDKEGVVFISALSWEKERPIIKFPFRPIADNRTLTTLVHADGSPWTAAELSVSYAKAWLRSLYGVIPHLLITEYVAPPPREQQGGGGNNNWGGGGGNRGGNQGGGYGGGGGGGNRGGGADFGDDDFPM